MSDNLSMRLHGRAELKSRIEPRDDPTMTIEWFKDDVPVRLGGRVNTFFNRGYAALIITGFEDEDSGRYSCIATNSFGTDRIEASLRLDTRYRTRDYETKSREEQVKRLQRIKDSMRLADQIEQERKAEREARLKRESEEVAKQRRLADIARRDERIEQARRRASEAKEKAESLKRALDEQKELTRSREQLEASRASETRSLIRPHSIGDVSGDGFIGEEDNFRYYIRRPYRELEDSIILKKEREIYETVTEYEPVKKKQVSDLAEKRANELEKIEARVRRLRGGDSVSTARSEPMIAETTSTDNLIQSTSGMQMTTSTPIPTSTSRTTDKPAPVGSVDVTQVKPEETKREPSEESDGFEEDSFIYTDLKVSESPTLDEQILSDHERLKNSLDRRESRRKVVFAEEDGQSSSKSIKEQYEGEYKQM